MKILFFRKNRKKSDDDHASLGELDRRIAQFKDKPSTWNERSMGNPMEIRESILNRLITNIEAGKRRNNIYRRRLSIAASFVFLLASSLIIYRYWEDIFQFATAEQQMLVSTEKGERKKIILSDGSSVWLNERSKLVYPRKFYGAKRVVQLLEGEAYFDVKHDVAKPFQVKADKTLTNVLGTAFNINAYKVLNTIRVTVVRGKVAVNKAIVFPDQQARYDKLSGRVICKRIESGNVVAWIDGKIAFTDEDFATIARQLEARYSVSISFSDSSTAHLNFTASFESGESLHSILEALTLTRGLRYSIDNGNQITIHE